MKTFDAVFEYVKSWQGLPATMDDQYSYMNFTFRLVDGYAAGGVWLTFEITDCIDDRMIGKHICCEVIDQGANGGGYYGLVEYRARVENDDGFLSNTDGDDGMGGSVVPELNGMQFWVPQRVMP